MFLQVLTITCKASASIYMYPFTGGWCPNTCTVQSFNSSKQGPRCWDQNKETSHLLSSSCGCTPTKGDCMFSATPDLMIHYFSLMFKIVFFFSSLCLKAPVKTHTDTHSSQTQGAIPRQEKFLWENWPEMHKSEGIFHSRVPYQLDISTYNQGVLYSFPFGACVCRTFLWYFQKWNLISALFDLIWMENKHEIQTNRPCPILPCNQICFQSKWQWWGKITCKKRKCTD